MHTVYLWEITCYSLLLFALIIIFQGEGIDWTLGVQNVGGQVCVCVYLWN